MTLTSGSKLQHCLAASGRVTNTFPEGQINVLGTIPPVPLSPYGVTPWNQQPRPATSGKRLIQGRWPPAEGCGHVNQTPVCRRLASTLGSSLKSTEQICNE